MSLAFEWDQEKAGSNLRKHGVAFEEASTVFKDTLSRTICDPLHSLFREQRFVTIGLSGCNQLLVVVHCDRGNKTRIISARRATRQERRNYENK
ncbi:MAG: BrnT family toxin [Kiritimatiellia bacterium]|jgi:hypothetical protein